ncbi:MAG: hypothetical protein HY791_12195 [Deltaproteobacteria bacterium]|nr:hypothetical protein [Deltaproteobacteria bacterium]
MSLILDAGALIAYERGNRIVRAFLMNAASSGDSVKTTTPVVAQVWRDGARQAHTAKLLRGVEEVELTQRRAREVGRLLRLSGCTDVVDASIVEIAATGDEILTSDPDDILRIADASGRALVITPVR